jgi:hypothetical protein
VEPQQQQQHIVVNWLTLSIHIQLKASRP